MRLDGLRIEPSAALGDDGLEVGEGGEVPIDDGFVDQGPEMLSRLQLRTVGRKEHPASSAAEKSLERPLARYHTVSPLIGRTKAATCSHR